MISSNPHSLTLRETDKNKRLLIMIYAQPGTPGALFTVKPRYGNYIGGQFVPPVNGQHFQNTTPVTGAA
ncbi:MAG: hypothetical protein GXZ05_00380, partial [Gammaproteobacteria bacterium]|nr:hypothetical protein [Gammaproteobacteria bacterium]